MNQLTKNAVQSCRYLHLLFNHCLPYQSEEMAKINLIDTLSVDMYRYMQLERFSKLPDEDLSLEQISGLAKYFGVSIDFLIDDKIVASLARLIDIKKEIRKIRATINSVYSTTNKNISPLITDFLNKEFRILEKEVIFNETNTR